MKVKELDKTVNLAWSPSAHVPVMLAAGTAAQQLDASFSTSAALDIYDLNLDEPGLDMELRSSIQSQNRFHKLVWGACGGGSGVIVGGCDNGRLQMYNASRVLAGDDGLLCSPERHTGHVKAIDFNNFQTNLLSSGASDSEIFIWDLNNVKTPMTPGAKSQPAEEVVWLSWNKQVQHILASAFATRCVVWDLRKNEPIIKLSDSNSRVRWKVVAWHPDVATQLCLASEEDSNPVIQLWDLRFATTPIKTLEGHQKGVLSIAWCAQDPDLLVSCGKDSRILCWNPSASHPGEEIVCEMVTSNQWNFEVSWCPRIPSLIATSSFDGHAGVYSLLGGQQQVQTTNKIADSFPGMEQYAEAPVVQPPHHAHVAVDLRKAPKWLKRPVGSSFGFGGKLVSFCSESGTVLVSQVVTEPALLDKALGLQQLLATGHLQEVCHGKTDPVWTFVAATLEPDPRKAMRTLLGLTLEQLEVEKVFHESPFKAKLGDIDGLDENFPDPSQHREEGFNNETMEEVAANIRACIISSKEPTSVWELKCEYEAVVGSSIPYRKLNHPTLESFLQSLPSLRVYGSGRDTMVEALDTDRTPQDIDNFITKHKKKDHDGSDEEGRLTNNFKIKIGKDKEGVICRALLGGDVELAVDLCVQDRRMTDAIILAHIAGPDILAKTQYKYFQQNQNYLSHLVSAVVTKDWSQVVSLCDLSSWAEALGAILTYATDDQLPSLCERLGDRLEREGGDDSRRNSEICFVAAGQLGHLIHNRIASDLSTDALQELIELVLVAQRGQIQDGSSAHLLDRYAQLLAAQGDFNTALAYLTASQQEDIEELRERLYIASGQKPYPTSQAQQNSYYQNTAQSGYGANYTKPGSQLGKQQQTSANYHQPPLPSATMFPAPANPQYPPAANQPYSMPSVTPPRKPSISNPLVSSFHQFSTSGPPTNIAQPTSSNTTSSFPPTSSNFTPSSSFPPSQPSFQPQNPPLSAPPANMFTPTSSAFAPPPSVQKPFAPSNFPPMPPPTSRTPVHFNSEPAPPPPPAANVPPTFSHRSSPSPIGGGSRKYVVDPSVGGGGSFRGSTASQFNSNPYASQPFSQPAAGYNSLPPQPFSQPAAGYNSQPSQPYSQPGLASYNNMAPQTFNPPVGVPPITSQPEAKPQQFVPQPPTAPGWNDPPSLSGTTRHQNREVQPLPPPITHPLFGNAPQEMPMQGGLNLQSGMGVDRPQHDGYGYSNANMMPPHPGMPPHSGMPQHQAAPPPAPVAKAVEPPRPKPPLPEEHMYLQTVFEELRNRCTCAANNPQLRRKLEDVSRKLEVLYDALRENKMSAATLSSLNQLVQLVQAGDYTSALHLHTQLVSGPDFSQISAFMPGLKVLIQSALQLGVYLQ